MARKTNGHAALVDRYLALTTQSKAIFKETCELEEQLLELVDDSDDTRVALGDGRILTRKDNFADKNTFFKPSATKRFEVVIV